MWKWFEAGIKRVKALDLSPGEIEEAKKRYAESLATRRQLGQHCTACEFQATASLGTEDWIDEAGKYDVVTCMFAIHYFFVTEAALQQFFRNVAANLQDGGYFIGTVPDGRRVNECIKGGKIFDHPMLRIEARWEGPPKSFGSPYICAIGDTVTGGDKGTEGSLEYLVYTSTLVAVAGMYGLKPVLEYDDDTLAVALDPLDADKPLKHFKPAFPKDSPESLAWASGLFGAFVFQKTKGEAAAPTLGAGARQEQQREHSVQEVGGKRKKVGEGGAMTQYKRPMARRLVERSEDPAKDDTLAALASSAAT
jgi:mRNA (guanine-N7-)-methyltransferase